MNNTTEQRFDIVIADTPARVTISLSALRGAIFADYQSNVVPTSLHSTFGKIEIHAKYCSDMDGRSRPTDATWIESAADSSERKFRIERLDIVGTISKRDTGILSDWTIFYDHPAQIHSTVKTTFIYALSYERKLLLHCSGVIRNEKLYLFVGPSGRGKTTIAEQLNGGGIPFCTDTAVIAVSNNPPLAHPTPFSDFKNVCPKSDPKTPTAVVFIEQAETHSLQPLSEIATGRGILKNMHFIPGSYRLTQALLDAAAEIASTVPGLHLKFRKDEGFWPLLDSWTT